MHALKLMLLGRLTGAWQFRWPALAAAFVVCIGGWIGVALIPNTYRSEAKVYIDTNTLLGPLLKGLAVTTDTDQEIAVMLRSLLANPNMQRVVLATDPTAGTMSGARMQDAIDKLRQNIALRNLGAVNLYNITYDGPDATYAQTVTQSLLSVLIDSNLGNQRRDSENVQSFLDSQIADYEQKLNLADKQRADFKSSHIEFFSVGTNGAPAEVGGGIVTATAAVTAAQKELDTATALRDTFVSQIKATPATLDVNAPAPVVSEGSQGAMGPAAQLTIARSRLNDLRTRFTDDYPDVIAQQHLIERLQAELKAAPNNSNGNTQGISNPTYVALKTKLADLQGTVVVDSGQLKRAQAMLDKAKQSALDAITVERQFENLNRDYDVLHQNYEQLVARRESANISQAANGQQAAVFQVISPPEKPDRPLAPNRLLLNAAVLLGGLAAGLGLSVVLSEFYGRFFGLERLTDVFSIPVLGSITLMRTSADTMKQRRSIMAFAGGVCVLLLAYLVVLYLFHSHLASTQPDIL